MKRLLSNLVCFILGILLLTGSACQGQNFGNDYKKVFKTYQEHGQLSLNIHYTVYADHEGSQIIETKEGMFKMDGKKQFQLYLNTENLECSPYHVFIDHKMKRVVCVEKTKAVLKQQKQIAKETKSNFAFQLIDSCITHLKKIEYRGTKAGISEYRLLPKSKAAQEFGIFIDTKTWLLAKMVIYSNAPVRSKGKTLSAPRAEITYYNINLHPVFKKDEFSIAQYGTIIKGHFTLNSKYKNYTVDYRKT